MLNMWVNIKHYRFFLLISSKVNWQSEAEIIKRHCTAYYTYIYIYSNKTEDVERRVNEAPFVV